MNTVVKHVRRSAFCGALAILVGVSFAAMGESPSSLFPLQPPVVSTVRSNCDVNPYGVGVVPKVVPGGGVVKRGNILVSDFNNAQNLEGTGTTAVRVRTHGDVSTSLTAALGVVCRGIVFVGNLLTADGTADTIGPSVLLALERNDNVIRTFPDPNYINGPWGIAIHDWGRGGRISISNALHGTVTRLDFEFSHDGEAEPGGPFGWVQISIKATEQLETF